MKNKLIWTTAALLGWFSVAEAQTVSVGPRLGTTFSKIHLSGDDGDLFNDGFDSNVGYQAGAVVNFQVSEVFSIQPELLYVQKGVKAEENGEFVKQWSNYVELPVLAKVSFGSEAVKAFLTAGPSVGYWLSAKSKYNVSGMEGTEDYEFLDEDNRAELSGNVGVGLAVKAGAGSVNFDVRYGIGLTSITEGIDESSKVKNRVLGVSVAYLFHL